jgi:hypothetical protein
MGTHGYIYMHATVTGSRGNPAGVRLTVRAVPYEQRRKGKEEDTG